MNKTKRFVTTILCAFLLCAGVFAFPACGTPADKNSDSGSTPVTTVTEEEWNAAFATFTNPTKNKDKLNLTIETILLKSDYYVGYKYTYIVDDKNKIIVIKVNIPADEESEGVSGSMYLWQSNDGELYTAVGMDKKDGTVDYSGVDKARYGYDEALTKLLAVSTEEYGTEFMIMALKPKGERGGEVVKFNEVAYDESKQAYTAKIPNGDNFIDYEVKFADKKIAQITIRQDGNGDGPQSWTCNFTYGTKAELPKELIKK